MVTTPESCTSGSQSFSVLKNGLASHSDYSCCFSCVGIVQRCAIPSGTCRRQSVGVSIWRRRDHLVQGGICRSAASMRLVTNRRIQNDLCETTPGVRSYSGHVHLPPGTADLGQGQDYPMNTARRPVLQLYI